jgi:hypothetical protein
VQAQSVHSVQLSCLPRTPPFTILCLRGAPLPQLPAVLFSCPPGERAPESRPEGPSAQSVLYRSLPLTSRASPRGVTQLRPPDSPRQPAALRLLRHIRRPSPAPTSFLHLFPAPVLLKMASVDHTPGSTASGALGGSGGSGGDPPRTPKGGRGHAGRTFVGSPQTPRQSMIKLFMDACKSPLMSLRALTANLAQ